MNHSLENESGATNMYLNWKNNGHDTATNKHRTWNSPYCFLMTFKFFRFSTELATYHYKRPDGFVFLFEHAVKSY